MLPQAMLTYAQSIASIPEPPQPAPSAAAAAQNPGGVPSALPPTASVAAACSAVAAGQACAARGLLLLGAYLGSVRSLGGFSLAPRQLLHVQQSVMPEACPLEGKARVLSPI